MTAFFWFVTGCGTGKTLKTPTSIQYDGSYITWDEVKGADFYLISINSSTAIEVTSNSYRYNANKIDFSVSIEAASRSEKISKSNMVQHDFRYLGKADNLRVENSTLTWDNVENATGYRVKINGQEFTVPVNEYPNVPVARNSVQVLPLNTTDTSYYGEWSDVYTYTILQAPTNVTYNSNEISWNHVTYASGYIVKVNSEEFTVTTGTKLNYTFDGQSQLIIKVKSLGVSSNDIYDSIYSTEVTYSYLEPVSQIKVEDGIVSWNPIANATSYIVEIKSPTDTKTVTVPSPSYSDILANTQYQIRVFAQTEATDYFFSSWSQVMNVRILPQPLLKYENGSFIWNSVSGATGFEAKIMLGNNVINSAVVSEGSSYRIDYTFPVVGTYTVQVKSTSSSSSEGVYASKFSEIFTVIRLDSPSNISFQHNVQSNDAATVIYNSVSNASGYRLYVDGVALPSIITTTSTSISETANPTLLERSWQIQVQATGSVNLSQRKIVLDSALSVAQTIKKLAVPTNLEVTNGILYWNGVAFNNGYLISAAGSTFLNQIDDRDYLISNLNDGSHQLSVRTLGNGTNIISSDYSVSFSVLKLSKPQVTVNNGVISWTKVDASSGYQYSVNAISGSFNVDVLSYTILNSDIVNQQVVFNIYAKGNGKEVLDSDASNTGVLTKLSTPQIRVTDLLVTWESVANATTYDFYIGNVVYQRGITGTSFSTSVLPANTYSFSVVAIGNPTTTIMSNPSNIIQITKLATPMVTRSNDSYVWNAVPGAQSYVVNILGNEYTTTELNFNPYIYFTTARTYSVSVQAVNSGVGYIDSDKLAISQEVQNLVVPTFTYSQENGKIVISIANASNHSQGNIYYINGNAISTINSTYEISPLPGTYTVQVSSKGGVFVEQVYFKDSLKSASVDLVYLQSPTNIQLSQPNLTQPIYQLTWNTLVGANYLYEIYDQNGVMIYSGTSTQSSVSSLNFSNVTSITVKIKAIAKSNTYFDSNWSEVVITLNS